MTTPENTPADPREIMSSRKGGIHLALEGGLVLRVNKDSSQEGREKKKKFFLLQLAGRKSKGNPSFSHLVRKTQTR